jgi:hypothetical protein
MYWRITCEKWKIHQKIFHFLFLGYTQFSNRLASQHNFPAKIKKNQVWTGHLATVCAYIDRDHKIIIYGFRRIFPIHNNK